MRGTATQRHRHAETACSELISNQQTLSPLPDGRCVGGMVGWHNCAAVEFRNSVHNMYIACTGLALHMEELDVHTFILAHTHQ